ncbi:MAG: tetratricopeptide repeat protein [Candidatus Omnitrophica bacterium]|nr:tetratricopeptide repeat protein [Candidatus Omnitrophota bacterium]
MFKRKGPLLFVCLFILGAISSAEAAVKDEAIRFRIQGYQIQHKGDLDKAAQKYKQAIEVDSNYAAPHNDLGIIYEEKGWHDQAEKEYLEALKIDPNYVDAYSNLVILYEKMHQKEKMLEALQKRVSLGDPDDVGTQEARAKLESLGMIVEVKPPAPMLPPPPKKVTLREPPPPKKVSPPEKEKIKEKKISAREVVKAEPKVEPKVKKVEPKKKGKEEELFEREVDPIEEATLLRNEGLKRQLRGDLDSSLRFYRTAIKVYPSFATAYNDLGVILEKKGFLEGAEAKYLKALSLDPEYSQALYNVAFLYVKMGKSQDAIGYLEKVVLQGGLAEEWVKIARNQLRVLRGEGREKETPRKEGRKDLGLFGEEREQTEAALRRKIMDELKHEVSQQEKLISLFEQGKAAYRKGEYETAQDFFETMLLIDPKNPLAKSYLEKTLKAIQEARRKEEEARRREEERTYRLAQQAKWKKDLKAKKKETLTLRLTRLKEEIENRKVAKEKERLAREAEEKALAEKKKTEQEALYEEAKKSYREGELQKSLLHFETLITSSPDHPYAKRYVTKIHEKLKEQEEELKIKKEQENAKAEAARQAELMRKQKVAAHLGEGERFLKKKNFKNAVLEFKAVIHLEPGHEKAERLLRKAEEGFEKEHQKKLFAKEKKKEDLLRASDERLKRRAQDYYEEGLRVGRRGETAKAIYAYEKALRLNPSHDKARKQLTSLRERETEEEEKSWRVEEARKTPQKPIESSPIEAETSRLYRRAKAAYDEGNYELSRQTLQYLLTLNPEHPFAQGDLEEVEEMIREKRHKEALAKASLKKEAERVIEPPAATEEETFFRAERALQGTEPFKREHLQEGFVRRRTPEEEAHFLMEQRALDYQQKGYELQQQHDIEGAISYYQKAMAIHPSAGTANSLGILYERKGWFVQAEDSYKKAVSLEPGYLAAHTNLALLYERLGRGEEAVRHWKVRSEMGEAGDLWTQKARTHLESARMER